MKSKRTKKHSKPILTHVEVGPLIEGDDQKGYALSGWAERHLATKSPEAQVILAACDIYGENGQFFISELSQRCEREYGLTDEYVSRAVPKLVGMGYLKTGRRKGRYTIVVERTEGELPFIELLARANLS